MKRLLLLAAALCAIAAGQPSNPSVQYVATAPTGNCGASYITVTISTGALTGCVNGSWASIGGSGSGGAAPIDLVFDGGGLALSGSVTVCKYQKSAVTINGVALVADQSGGVTIDVKTVAYSSYTGPASASSITAAATPALSSAAKYKDTTLTGWSKSIAADTMVCFAMSSPSTIIRVQVTLSVQ